MDIGEVVRQSVAVIVATRDEELRPEVCRAWGPVLTGDETRLTLCVEHSPETARNLEAGSPLTAMLARLTSQVTLGLTGQVVDVAPLTDEHRAAVDAHIERFVAEGASVGVPETTARSLAGPELVSVTIAVTERTDETPGAETGRRV
jgi:hypothetical protein